MTMTGRLPVLMRASAKICSRLGVRRAEMQPTEIDDSAISAAKKKLKRD